MPLKQTQPFERCDRCRDQFSCPSEDGECPTKSKEHYTPLDYSQTEASMVWMESDKSFSGSED